MAEVPDEARELRLVNNVEFKIALADSDAKLQPLLSKFLAPLLLKLMSPHVSVRNKVIAVCNHLSTRITPPTLILPVKSLLEQFMDPDAGGKSMLLRNFDLIYINTGLDRLSVEERRELLPVIIRGRISQIEHSKPRMNMFNILLRLLPDLEIPERGSKDDDALREFFKFDENAGEAEFLARYFQGLMLLNVKSRTSPPTPGVTPGVLEFLSNGKTEGPWPAPGLSLQQAKVAVMKFVASGAFTDREKFMVALAARDAESAVAGFADDVFKRAAGNVSLEEDNVVEELYNMLLGARDESGKAPPVTPTLQARIFPLLSQSRTAVSQRYKDNITALLPPALDTSYARLRQATFAFVRWAARIAEDELVESIAPQIIDQLRYWIINDETNKGDDITGEAYEILALMASRCRPVLADTGLDIVRFLYDRLESERGGVVDSVERALGTVLVGLLKARLPDEVQQPLEELILQVVSSDTRGRSQAVKWAGRLLPFHSVVGRWVGVLASDMGGTVAEEGSKALHPYYYRLINPEAAIPLASDSEMDIDSPETTESKYSFPDFVPLVSYLFSSDRQVPHAFKTRIGGSNLPPKSFTAALSFCKSIAIWQGLSKSSRDSIKIDEDWGRNTDATIIDESTRPSVEAYFAQDAQKDALRILLKEAWYGMVAGNEGLDGARSTWNELASLVPQDMLKDFVPRINEVVRLLKASKSEARRVAAEALGLLGSHPDVSNDVRAELTTTIATGVQESDTGAIAAAGFLFSRMKMRGNLNSDHEELINRVVKTIASILTDSRDSLLLDIAIDSLGELLAFAVFQADVIDVGKLRTTFTERAKRGDEKSVLTLGYTTFLSSEDTKSFIEDILKIGESASVEMSFVVGEAVTAVAAQWGSSALRRKRAIAGVEWTGPRRNSVAEVLAMLLQRAGEPGGGGKRRTTIVALLSLLELCPEDQGIKEKLGDVQAIFRSFLTDRDDFIQETAARGLTAVYNLSDEATRTDLVRSLVSSFTGESREKIQVTHDTQLFEPGALPTGDGKSVGSYGDIMSLAAELGDPTLVYKFMSLARHNSVWSSRAAFGRFGLGTLLSGSDEIKNNSKLWPVLFRYRFDPTPAVRQSMESIWSALGGGPETIERWWKEILAECLKSALNGREWRVREASISALGDLLSGRKVTAYKDQLEDIWRVDFMVLDDVKESCRIAAMKLARILTNGMVRALEGEMRKSEKDDILGVLMEFLMGKRGVEAESKDVQMFALDTLLKVVKNGGETLRKWIPDLMERLIMVMSDLEPEAVNYLIMNADKYDTTGEAIDRVRLNAIRSSPIMSAIESLIDAVDSATLELTVPRITRSIRTSLGLPSKVACSRVVVSLAMKQPVIFKPHSDDIFKVLLPALKDRSETVSRSYAVATGYLARISSDAAIISASRDWAQTQYWTGEVRERLAAAAVISAIWKHATDRAAALASETLPFVFIAKQDKATEVADEFKAIWTENTGGSGAVKLYLKEIVDLATAHLTSQRWDIKQTCALALADAAVMLATASDVTTAQANALYPALVAAVNGKSWVGKETVLEGFVKFLVAIKGLLSDARIVEVKKILLREAKRNNLPFRAHALHSLGDFLRGFPDIDMFDTVLEFVQEALNDIKDQDAMDIDDADGGSSKVTEAVTKNALYCVGSAFRLPAKLRFTSIMDLLSSHAPLSSSPPGIKLSTLSDLTYVLSKLQKDDLSEPQLGDAWNRITQHLQDRGSEAARSGAVKAVKELLRIADSQWKAQHEVVKTLKAATESERAAGVREGLREIIKEEERAT